MNRGSVVVLPLAIGIVITGVSTIAPSRADNKDDFKPLFDGKDLERWEATKPELWSVKDGVIIGDRVEVDAVKVTEGGELIAVEAGGACVVEVMFGASPPEVERLPGLAGGQCPALGGNSCSSKGRTASFPVPLQSP